MKIVVVGGTGLIGSKVVTKLREHGHEAVSASPDSGVNTLTGEGLSEVLDGAATVVDVTNSPSFEEAATVKFFETSTRNLLASEAAAGVGHHVALSVVGTERLGTTGYLRGKAAQERLIVRGAIPYSIVHATQFFEFVNAIAEEAAGGDTIRVSPALIQPMAAQDVAAAVARVAVGAPLNGVVEVGGPETFRFEEFVGRWLAAHNDSRPVVSDPQARYYGYQLSDRDLIPEEDAKLGATRFDDWLGMTVSAGRH